MERPVEELERTWELCRRIDLAPDRANLEGGLLEPIGCLLGAEMAVFRVFSLNSEKPIFLTGLGIPDAVHDAYLNRYFKLDPIRNLTSRRFGGPLFADLGRPGQWLDGRISTSGEQRRHTSTTSIIARYRANFHQYQTEFLCPYNLYHHLGFCFQDMRENRTFVFNFMRGHESSAFGQLEFGRAKITALLLHAGADRFTSVIDFAEPRRDGAIGDRIAATERCRGFDKLDKGRFDTRLSARELEVAEVVALGLTNKEVGDALGISVRTVENHMRSIFAKLEVSTRTRLAAKLRETEPDIPATRRRLV